MLPSIRHRLIIALAVILGAASWLAASGWFVSPDGGGGLALTSTRVGVIAAVAVVAVAGLPAMGVGLLTSAMGHPVSGVFAVATALGALAAVGGSIEGWLRRADPPGGYRWLIVETLIWQAGVIVMLMVIQRLRSPLLTRWPALAFHDHLGVDVKLQMPRLQALAAGAISAAVAAAGGCILIANADTGQVICGLTIVFMIGALIAQTALPQTNPVGVLSSPFLVAAVSYLYVLVRYDAPDPFLRAWFDHSLPGLALALPVHYASAGVAGCALGLGLAQSFSDSMAGPKPTPD